MISIHLYGKLRHYASDNSPSGQSVIEIEEIGNETLQTLLDRVGIDADELYTIFINHKLLTSRTKVAPFLGYQQVCDENCQSWDLHIEIKAGDRLGLFGPDMPALVI
ncbi:MAG: hypothetical protein U9Q82_11420 [Chloroflexota bacterium]|nr:hypothetical protein [Chloroflexota bacterium]